jgi:hypothetical protein
MSFCLIYLSLSTKLQLLGMLQFEPIRRPWGTGKPI